jgi:hypothetical protein
MAFMAASEAIRAPRAEEALSAINYLFACLSNAFSLAIHVTSLDENDRGKLDWMLDIEPFRWPQDLQKHFLCPGKKITTQIRNNSKQVIDDCIQHIRSEVVLKYVDSSRPEISQLASDINDCLLCIENIAKRQKSEGSPQFSELLAECDDVFFSSRPTDWRRDRADSIIQNLLKHLIDKKNFDIPEFIFDNLYRFAKRLSSPITIQEAYSNKVFGPYFILRKARGVVTNSALDREVIVRDVLWIRPLKQEPDAEGVRSEQQTNPTICLGYYVSAIDKQIYEITSVSVRGDFVLIDAVAFLSGAESKSLCMYMPKIPLQQNPKPAFGSIIGMLRSAQRTGSWSMIPLRPLLPDSELLRQHFVFMFFAECFSLDTYQDRLENYDPNIAWLYEIFANHGLCGVLFSQDWLRRAKESAAGVADGVKVEDLERRLFSFDDCFDRSGDYLNTLLGHIDIVTEEEQELFSQLGEKGRKILGEILLRIFNQSEQTAINPLPNFDVSVVSETLANPLTAKSLPYIGTD